MNRKDFIRNTLLGLAAAMLPEILRPSDVGLRYSKGIIWQIQNAGHKYEYTRGELRITLKDINEWVETLNNCKSYIE